MTFKSARTPRSAKWQQVATDCKHEKCTQIYKQVAPSAFLQVGKRCTSCGGYVCWDTASTKK